MFNMINDKGEISDKFFKDINVTRFKNSRRYRKSKKVAEELGSVYIISLKERRFKI